ncbi:MAG: transposase [Ferrovum sp.]|nr:transposase [Ferrovum sp.]NDU87478.1 transposase [Ferrovum sp.]
MTNFGGIGESAVTIEGNTQKAKVQRIHTGIANARKDFLHKTTTTISQNHALICIEDLQVRNMSKSSKGNSEQHGKKVAQKSGLNRSILDQGWGEFRRQLDYKVSWNGGMLLAVPPRNSSRTCPCCGHVSKDNRLTQSKFLCVEMGLINANPCKQVRRNEEKPGNREVLDAEVTAFLPLCPQWLQAYLEVKLLTGLRQGDMLRLSLFSIRDDGLFVLTGKRDKRILFQWTPVLKAAIDQCKALRRKPSDSKLFEISASGFKAAWSRAMAKYDGEKFAENDLRAKVATQAIDEGRDATSMLGHSSDAVTRRHYIRGTRKVKPMR